MAGPGVRVGAGGGLARLPDGGGARPSSAGRVLLPDGWCEDERPQESHEFGAGQQDELGCSGRVGCGRGCGGECEDGGGDQGEQGPAHPGVLGGHLTFVRAGECLAKLEGLLDPLSVADDVHELREGDVAWRPEAEEGEFAGVPVPTGDQDAGAVLAMSRPGCRPLGRRARPSGTRGCPSCRVRPACACTGRAAPYLAGLPPAAGSVGHHVCVGHTDCIAEPERPYLPAEFTAGIDLVARRTSVRRCPTGARLRSWRGSATARWRT